MRDESTLIHYEHVSAKSFDEVVAAFEKAVVAGDGETFRKAVRASSGQDDFEARMRAAEVGDASFQGSRFAFVNALMNRLLDAA